MKLNIAKVLLASAIGLCAQRATAQSYSIDWHTIDGGGGTSTSGVYSVSGTIGQPDANQQPMTGGSFSLTGGFWSLFAVQTPGAPLLTISLTSTNTVMVSWPATGLTFQLQENADFSLPNSWSPIAQAAVTNAGQISVIVPTTAGRKFFRLKSQ